MLSEKHYRSMEQIDDNKRLHHIVNAATQAMGFVQGLSREHLDMDEKLALALTRLLEIVGEAGAQVSSEMKNRYPDIPWNKIIGMRNKLIHGYFDVNLDMLWQTIMDDLPPLVEQLQEVLKKIER